MEETCYECGKPWDMNFIYVSKNHYISQAFLSEWDACYYALDNNLEYIDRHKYNKLIEELEICEVEDKYKLITDNITQLIINGDDFYNVMYIEKIPFEWKESK